MNFDINKKKIPDDLSTEDWTITPPPESIFFTENLKKYAKPFVDMINEIIKINNKGVFPEIFPNEISFTTYVRKRANFLFGYQYAILSMLEIYDSSKLNSKNKDTKDHLLRYIAVSISQLKRLIEIGKQNGYNIDSQEFFEE